MFKRFFKKKKKEISRYHIVTNSHSKSVITEQYRTVRTNIEYSAIDKDMKTILVTSATPGDGKSTTAVCSTREKGIVSRYRLKKANDSQEIRCS